MKVLVTGGVRSGKSRHAQRLVDAAAGSLGAVYVAPGPTADEDSDPDWLARLAAHRASRPGDWTTVETGDLAAALAQAAGRPVMVDCLGTWLTALLDRNDLWESSVETMTSAVESALVETTEAMAEVSEIVLVTNEVGLGVVPVHRSGRVFRDLLGLVNQRVAEACDEVHLVVSGRVLVL